MAASRERRSTAGNRMSKVLEEELEEDDFYKTTYGGFEEEEEDGDFDSEQEDSADEVDSDFDNPEEEDDDQEVKASDDEKPKRKRGINTKAYKEPNPKRGVAASLSAAKKPRTESVPKQNEKGSDEDDNNDGSIDTQNEKTPKPNKLDAKSIEQVRKSSRHSTAKNSLLTHIRKKEREEENKKKKGMPKKQTIGVRRLTQEELMAEAEKTERKNVKSLENYLRLEESRKKSMNLNKRSCLEGVATIRSVSLTMRDPDVNAATQAAVAECADGKTATVKDDRYEQEFYIFSDYESMAKHYDEALKTVHQPPPQPMCPVSGKPARYRDPLTGIPFYDVAALGEIRAVYEAELKGAMASSDDDDDANLFEKLIKAEPSLMAAPISTT